MVRVGLIGCGTIGSRLARLIQKAHGRSARVVALHDTAHRHAAALQQQLTPRPTICSLAELIRRSDLVIEAASTAVAADVVRRALRAGREVLVMSAGGLLRDRTWRAAARGSGGRVYVPSGALAGIDGVRALAVGAIRRLELTTRKPPRALAGAPGLRRRRTPLARLTRPTVVFEGPPREAVRAFPDNTNVAATLTLAGGRGRARSRIRIIADPRLRVNVHELDVEGDCGRIRCRVQSRPSANPKTSELAVRSAAATLARIFDRVTIGT